MQEDRDCTGMDDGRNFKAVRASSIENAFKEADKVIKCVQDKNEIVKIFVVDESKIASPKFTVAIHYRKKVWTRHIPVISLGISVLAIIVAAAGTIF